MPGPNVDVRNFPPDVAQLKLHHIDAVRMVSHPDRNGPGVDPLIEEYLKTLKESNIFALVVLDSDSRGRIPANNHGWIQFGNEPDGKPNTASWVMTPDYYVDQFNLYRDTYPQFNWIAAGLCAGDFSAGFLKSIAARLHGCAGFALHLYGKTPAQAVQLIAAHRAAAPAWQAFVTEFNCTAVELGPMLGALRKITAGQYWYASGDWMNAGFGLFDHPDKLAAWDVALTPPPKLPAPAKPKILLRLLTPYSYGYGDVPGRLGKKIRFIVNHVAEGNGSLYGWFSGRELSTHFWVSKTGIIEQYVPFDQAAYGQGIVHAGSDFPPEYPGTGPDYNRMAFSIEREGYHSEEATPAQWAAIVALNRWLASTFKIPTDADHIVGHYRTDRASRAGCPSTPSLPASLYMARLVADIRAKAIPV
jgi:hypothetical protein